jgi:5-methylcytosine-specific restriction endonuclease McrA
MSPYVVTALCDRHRPVAEGVVLMHHAALDPLSASVLVLNRFYLAVHVINVRRALSLLCRRLAEVIHIEDGQYANYSFESWRDISEIRPPSNRTKTGFAASTANQVPRVIRLLWFDRVPKQTVHSIAATSLPRRQPLQYCGKSFDERNQPGSRLPRSRGGQTTWENIVCCCVSCNVRKGGRTPHEAHLHLVRPPAKPKRSPLLSIKLGNPKYESWKTFLDNAYWTVDLK